MKAFSARMVMMVACLMMVMVCAAGCTLQKTWVESNKQFQDAVVDGVLIPHYMADPTVSAAAKQNVSSANSEHKAALAEWEAVGAK